MIWYAVFKLVFTHPCTSTAGSCVIRKEGCYYYTAAAATVHLELAGCVLARSPPDLKRLWIQAPARRWLSFTKHLIPHSQAWPTCKCTCMLMTLAPSGGTAWPLTVATAASNGCYARIVAKCSLTFSHIHIQLHYHMIMEFLGCGRLTNAESWCSTATCIFLYYFAAKSCPQIQCSSKPICTRSTPIVALSYLYMYKYMIT